MRFSKGFGNWRIYGGLHRTVTVGGVNSILEDGRHVLMWDFDDTDGHRVDSALREVQMLYDLGEIQVLRSNEEGGFHAYCLQPFQFSEAVMIILQTRGIDSNYIALAVRRGYFTLRFTPKYETPPRLLATLLGNGKAEMVDVLALKSLVRYRTGNV